jgi:hypothetical protein
MFFVLRVAVVIAVLVYLSPMRRSGEGDAASMRRSGESDAAAVRRNSEGEAAPATSAEAERLWRSLPPEAREVVLDSLRAQVAATLREAVAGAGKPAADPGHSDGRRRTARSAEEPSGRP